MHWARQMMRSADGRPSGFLLSAFLTLALPALAQAPARKEIDAAARTFMERSHAPGLAIGIVSPEGANVFFYGLASKETGAPVDERTLFEVGSISKIFTVTLAAYAAEAGALRWEDSPGRHLPELKGSRLDQVSLLNLATHTTGGMPLQLPGGVTTEAALIAYFRNWAPPAPPGSTRTYANPSIGLLGMATARALKGDFTALVHEHVSAPLGLRHTFHQVPPAEQRHYAQGYTREGRPVHVSPAPLATEAYGLRTTAGDLLRFVGAQIGLVGTSPALGRAMAATRRGHFQAGPMTQALIWEWYALPVTAADFAGGHGDAMVFKANPVTRLEPPATPSGDTLIEKTGATNGFGAYVAFMPGRRTGLVLLANRNHPTATRLALAGRVFAALGVEGLAGQP